jgi:hypothetical protein
MVRGTCFICLQSKNKRKQPVPLNNIQINCCPCNALVHVTCIEEWYNKCLKCPICRIYVSRIDKESKEEQEQVQEQDEIINMYNFPPPDEEAIEHMVAAQLVTTFRRNFLTNAFYSLRQQSRNQLIIYSIWSIFLGLILLLKTTPAERGEII